MPGPAKQPTKLKAIKGTLEKKQTVPNEMDFDAIQKIPLPPEHFDERAKKEWRRVVVILNNIGMLYEVDLPLLQSYCFMVSLLHKAEQELKKSSFVVIETNKSNNKYTAKNKWVSIYNETLDRVIKLAREFGFTPSSRTGINMPKNNAKDKLYLD